MTRRRLLIMIAAALSVSVALHATADDDEILLVGASVIDGLGNPPVPREAVLIRGDRIVATGSAAEESASADAERVDVTGKFIVPGLIDSHAHLDATMVFGLSDDEKQRTIDHNFNAFLYNGVTTVLNLSSDLEWILDARERQRSGAIVGPRVLACGRSFTPIDGWGSRHGGALDTLDVAAARLEHYLESGVDGIKLVIEDGLGEGTTYNPMPHAWTRALALRTHEAGVPVYVHAIESHAYMNAIDVRPRAIVHGSDDRLTDAQVDQIVQSGAAVIPTLSLWASFYNLSDETTRLAAFEQPALAGSVPDFVLDRLRTQEALAEQRELFLAVARMDAYEWAQTSMSTFVENTRRLHQAGVRIGAGTDGGGPVGYNFQGYNLPYEVELLGDAGLSPLEAIAAATSVNAWILGLEHELGSITPGKIADLVVLNADPTSDLRNLRSIRHLMQGGRMLDRDALAWSP